MVELVFSCTIPTLFKPGIFTSTHCDMANLLGTATSTIVGSAEDEKPRYHANDTYISPSGMVTSEGTIGMLLFHSPITLTAF